MWDTVFESAVRTSQNDSYFNSVLSISPVIFHFPAAAAHLAAAAMVWMAIAHLPPGFGVGRIPCVNGGATLCVSGDCRYRDGIGSEGAYQFW